MKAITVWDGLKTWENQGPLFWVCSAYFFITNLFSSIICLWNGVFWTVNSGSSSGEYGSLSWEFAGKDSTKEKAAIRKILFIVLLSGR